MLLYHQIMKLFGFHKKQMAELFNKDRRTITRHIQNIIKSEELDKDSVCSYFEHTASDGKYIKYNTIT